MLGKSLEVVQACFAQSADNKMQAVPNSLITLYSIKPFCTRIAQ